jgi:hypothetical protein
MDIRIVTGEAARDVLHMLGVPKDKRARVHTLRVAIDGDNFKIKVNEECWSPPLGSREGLDW